MKGCMYSVFLCVLAVSSFARELQIRKVRVISDSDISPEMVKIVAGIKEGDEISEENLKNYLESAKRRLENTTWFFFVGVYAVPPRKYPDKRTIVIEVKKGFLWRFGGGYAYGFVGYENLWGEGDYVETDAGYNVQKLTYRNRVLWNTPLFYELKIGHSFVPVDSPSVDGKFISGDISASLDFGYWFGSFRAGVSFGYGYSYIKNDACPDSVFAETFKLNKWHYVKLGSFLLFDTTDDFFSPSSGSFVSARYSVKKKLELSNYGWDWEMDIRKYVKLGGGVKGVLKTAFGRVGGKYELSEEKRIYGIYDFQGVRTAPNEKLEGVKWFVSSAEIRFPLGETAIFGFFNTDFELTLFCDYGRAFDENESIRPETGISAVGTGLRAFFRMPVFVPFRFEVSIDKNKRFNFFFSAVKPI